MPAIEHWETYHVVGFYDLVDLWVIKIKKPIILCTRTSKSSEQSMKLRSLSENSWKLCYFIVKVIRLCDYQTWQTHFCRNSRGAQRFVGIFCSWLCFRECWLLSRQTRSHGMEVKGQWRKWILSTETSYESTNHRVERGTAEVLSVKSPPPPSPYPPFCSEDGLQLSVDKIQCLICSLTKTFTTLYRD